MLQLLLLLLLSSTSQRVSGYKKSNACVCQLNSTMWLFPAQKFKYVLEEVHTCEESLNNLQEEVRTHLYPYNYLRSQGLYTELSLHQLGQVLSQLQVDIDVVHSQLNNSETQKLSKEAEKLHKYVNKMQTIDTLNMKTVKEKLRYLKNKLETCKSIPKDFRGLITNISDPITAKVSPFGKSCVSGSWGKQSQKESEGQKNSYWVQALLSSYIWGNTVRLYQTYEDLMASTNHRDFTFASSYSHPNAIEGPSAVLYGKGLYYNCFRSADVCRYDLETNEVKRVTLPGTGVGFNNKFPYCYYDCQLNSDVDVEADETGLWVLYATIGNHGNIVISRLVWDSEVKSLNVTQTWETRLFKKAASNAFMVCGVMYATRYVNEYREEVFYAFDTATGKEDNSLAIPLEKVAKAVASLSYNPTNKQIYMYNDGYLLAYQVYF
uniref:Olfactomedin-like n=1 Tax=Neolamprologus brichardi TaxID=32507 RepID=A0A3Q4N7F2_NEOBR